MSCEPQTKKPFAPSFVPSASLNSIVPSGCPALKDVSEFVKDAVKLPFAELRKVTELRSKDWLKLYVPTPPLPLSNDLINVFAGIAFAL